MTPKTAAIIVAAGSSRRMGFDKLMAPLGGEPVLWRSIQAFAGPEISQIVVVTSDDRRDALAKNVAALGRRVVFVPGGAERHLSVAEGLRALAPDTEFVAVHDGARPLVSRADLARVIAKAHEVAAASLAHPVVDTVKRADAAGRVTGAVDRTGLWGMETPQVFSLPLLRRAYDAVLAAGKTPTDEVSAVEFIGHDVFLVESTAPNLKITHPQDLALAGRLLTP